MSGGGLDTPTCDRSRVSMLFLAATDSFHGCNCSFLEISFCTVLHRAYSAMDRWAKASPPGVGLGICLFTANVLKTCTKGML